MTLTNQLLIVRPPCCSFARATSYTTDADARSHEVKDLESGTLYVLRVGAVNINGTGELSPWVEKSTYTAQLDGR